MRLRAVPRGWPDIKPSEIISMLLDLFRIERAASPGAAPEFEREFARTIGARGAVSFPSCTSAMYFTLRALDLSPGDEVLLPAFTYPADAAMVALAGLKPVFVDVDLATANMDPGEIEKKITDRTRVIFPTHLNGISADMDSICRIARGLNLRIIEDCARACGVSSRGRMLGSFDTGVFSFGYGKNLYLLRGGMATSNDESVLGRLHGFQSGFRRLSNRALLFQTIKGTLIKIANEPHIFRFTLFPLLYAQKVKGSRFLFKLVHPDPPSPDRLLPSLAVNVSSLQARQGLRFLRRLEDHNRKRQRNALRLERELSGISGLFHFRSAETQGIHRISFALGSEKKKDIQRFLFENKIDIEDESAGDLTRLAKYAPFAGGARYPRARDLDGKLFFLPNHPGLSDGDLAHIIAKVKEFCGA